MNIVVGIDPGDKNTGYVSLDGESGAIRGRATLDTSHALAFISGFETIQKATGDLIYVCMEVFQLYPEQQRVRAWSSFPIIEEIGAIKYILGQAHIPLQMGRPPDINRFMKKRPVPKEIPRSGGGEHQVSAYRLAEYMRIMYVPELSQLRNPVQ